MTIAWYVAGILVGLFGVWLVIVRSTYYAAYHPTQHTARILSAFLGVLFLMTGIFIMYGAIR